MNDDKLLHIEPDIYDECSSYEELARFGIEVGCDTLAMPTGIVSRVTGLEYEVVSIQTDLERVKPGQKFHLGNTFCRDVIRSQTIVAHSDHVDVPMYYKHPIYIAKPLRSYIGTPIFQEDVLIGTLDFASSQPRHPFTEFEIQLVIWMASVLGRYRPNRG